MTASWSLLEGAVLCTYGMEAQSGRRCTDTRLASGRRRARWEAAAAGSRGGRRRQRPRGSGGGAAQGGTSWRRRGGARFCVPGRFGPAVATGPQRGTLAPAPAPAAWRPAALASAPVEVHAGRSSLRRFAAPRGGQSKGSPSQTPRSSAKAAQGQSAQSETTQERSPGQEAWRRLFVCRRLTRLGERVVGLGRTPMLPDSLL